MDRALIALAAAAAATFAAVAATPASGPDPPGPFRLAAPAPDALARLGVIAEPLRKHLMVTSLSDRGPARRAGLRVGDAIIAIDGHRIRASREAEEWLPAHGHATLSVERGGAVSRVEVNV